jgi:3-deoxy-D-manno-octulosonate 8-phosphate phosphatase (KDO 8-P phosphatase)
MAGLPVCPADAATDIQEICELVLTVSGGQGCARLLLETAMKLQNTWHNNDTHTW